MKRWALLIVLFATPLSSPMACGGDGCLRNSDCAADEVCSAGSCVPETPVSVAVGGETNEAGETSAPSAGTSSGSGGSAGSEAIAGTGGSAGTSGSGGSETTAGQPSASEGGAGGAITDPIDEGGAGIGGALDLGGAGVGGTL